MCRIVELATFTFVEGDTGAFLFYLFLDPPIRGEVGGVCFITRAFATSQDSDDAAPPVEGDRPQVAPIRELAGRLVAQNSEVDGRVGYAVRFASAGESLETVNTWCPWLIRFRRRAGTSPCWHRLGIEVLGILEIAILDDARDL